MIVNPGGNQLLMPKDASFFIIIKIVMPTLL